jgi:nucleotide-binding universal stress UspA family protein
MASPRPAPKLSEEATRGGTRVIVVGVDGSTQSTGALRWALAEARLRSVPVRVVNVWQLPLLDLWGPLPQDLLDPKAFEQRSLEVVDRALADVDGATAGVAVERLALEGDSARGLIAASAGEELLVVGSRGHGGFTGLLLGSVSGHCVQHAACPVVVVRPPKE